MAVQFGALICEAFIEVGHHFSNLGLVEHVERVHEGVVEHQIAEAHEGTVRVEPDEENPRQIAHALHVPNVWPVELKQLQQSLDLRSHSPTFLLIELEVHSAEVEVDDGAARRFVLHVVLELFDEQSVEFFGDALSIFDGLHG